MEALIRFKHRLKSFDRKKQERLLLDMPTTDPGSDLIFSTDEEITDAVTSTIRYATLPQRTKRHLLSSELQRRYVQESGDGLGIMPQELVIITPSNKDKQKIRAQMYKSATAKLSGHNSQRPFVIMPSVRTRSWHNLKTSKRTLLSYKAGDAKNKAQSPIYRTKKEVLNKEDLNIQLSLKKKIWSGTHQPDKTSVGIDRNKPLSWMAPHFLRVKSKTAEKTLYGNLNDFELPSCNNTKKGDNRTFFFGYNRKLLEWQMLSKRPNESPYSQEKKELDIKEDRTVYTAEGVSNLKVACKENRSKNKYNEISNEVKPKRKIKTSKILAKISKSRNNMLTSHHTPMKPLIQNKSHARSHKFKTGGLVATALQTGVSDSSTAAKNSRKSKSIRNKLQSINNYNTNSPEIRSPQIFLPHNYDNNAKNNENSLEMTATAKNIVQKAKTKIKNKKLFSSTKPDAIA